ncbi:unnamed protein product [Rhizoctonia solani]|uniref:Uncharacterized protein n=2 Tax=Rhizoctonia solani TaxID=456999 RepID=A0A8H3H8N8_9AGAM|nr:hypothetical protein V565_081840 [Rhizoctonia solani 123E]CAE6493492.1 unnamed protein product [Rhizoctonia solani]
MADSSRTRVAQIPELLRFIHRHATPGTRTSLLQVSRSFFSTGAPIMWESVEGVHNLLRLIPNTAIVASAMGISYKLIITLPSAPDLSRFNMYAHYIRKLEIYCPNDSASSDSITLTNWMVLSAHSRAHGLLPNLSQLSLQPTYGWDDDNEPFIWARTFMSSSLTAIHFVAKVNRRHSMTFPTASTLLRHAVSNCPNLHKLSLVTLEQHMAQKHSNLPTALTFWDPSYYESLSSLPLRELCCGASLLLPDNIYALTKLQSLERLELHGDYGLPTRDTLSPKMLPLLNTLILVAARWSDVIGILKLNVYFGVKSLEICVAENYDGEVLDGAVITSLTTLITSCCPTLINLEIDCGDDYYFSLEDVSVFQALAGLPLRSVCLMNMSFPRSMLVRLLSFFPLASTIKMPDCLLNLAELHYFSQLPNLVHLAIDIFPVGVSTLPQTLQSDSIKAALNFQVLEIASSPTNLSVDLSPLARYLLSIWPNLRRVIWTEGRGPEEEDREISKVIANALNALISTHRLISNANR